MVNIVSSSVAGIIKDQNSSFYFVSLCGSFQKWVNVGNIVNFHCSLLKHVSNIASIVPKKIMPSALLLDIQELMK